MGENREQVAEREIGHTDVVPWLSRVLVACFLLTIVAVPCLQTAVDVRQFMTGDRPNAVPQSFDAFRIPVVGGRAWSEADGGAISRLFAANREMLRSIHSFEDTMEKRSRVGAWLRKRLQEPMTRFLGVGNEQVYCGRHRWLFFRPSVDHLTGPGFLDERQLARRAATGTEWQQAPSPNPVPAILEFRDQLAARGIELLILPVPVKASIHPDLLSRRYRATDTPVHNPSYDEFVTALEARGVRIFDPTPVLERAAASSGEAQYLATDTHWTPAAVDAVAKDLAAAVRDMAGLSMEQGPRSTSRELQVESRGDLAEMLDVPSLFPTQSVTIEMVEEPEANSTSDNHSAAVLLLGDSFANIYQQRELGWGHDAGLAQRLGYHLRHPVDAIVRNDDGAFATRLLFNQEIRQNSPRFSETRILIWEFTARELSFGDWRRLPMAETTTRDRSFVVPHSGAAVVVEGTVAALSEVPNPQSAPYADFIVGMHLVDLQSDDILDGDQALVFSWAMRNRQLTRGAEYRVGQRLRLVLRPWADVSSELAAITRGELYENNLFLETPCWGEEVDR